MCLSARRCRMMLQKGVNKNMERNEHTIIVKVVVNWPHLVSIALVELLYLQSSKKNNKKAELLL